MPTPPPFRIGLCMAGAVSAGAYTAGAVDYLVEALDDWALRRARGDADVPTHRVEVPVIGGASAGGMTGVLLAAHLDRDFAPVHRPPADQAQPLPNNPLYHTWVDMLGDDMLGLLLAPDDISASQFESLLNARFIDTLADRAFAPYDGLQTVRRYFPPDLKLFVTLSNLEGMEYDVSFQADAPQPSPYLATSHRDYACFRLATSEGDYRQDGWIPLNFRTGLHADLARQAALATGAFPLGLAARALVRPGRYLNDLDWFKHITRQPGRQFRPQYGTVQVDGGMIDNEPFERVRQVLNADLPHDRAELQQHPDHVESTVLLIDPLPREPSGSPDADALPGSTALTSVLGGAFNALLNQARIKGETVANALRPDHAGQYLIAPVRYADGVPVRGAKALASGALDGFSGFFSKEFRMHDYFLGRANCEKFLRDHFTVPADTANPIFAQGYAAVADKSRFYARGGPERRLPIVPLFSPRTAGPYLPTFSNGQTWPTLAERKVLTYRGAIRQRAERALRYAAGDSPSQRVLLWIGAKVVLNRKIEGFVTDTALAALREHGLIG